MNTQQDRVGEFLAAEQESINYWLESLGEWLDSAATDISVPDPRDTVDPLVICRDGVECSLLCLESTLARVQDLDLYLTSN